MVDKITENQIYIKLKASDYHSIDTSAKEIVKTVKATGAGRVKGPIPLPTRNEIFGGVLVSPNIDSDAKDQYQRATHKRLIIIVDPTNKTMDALKELKLSMGVQAEISVEQEVK